MSDLSAGIAVAVMHIPQGMAYALLANTDPIVGIYTAFFPVIVYVFLGTSKHISLGTFAVTSILVSKTVADLTVESPSANLASTLTSPIATAKGEDNVTASFGGYHPSYTSVQVITALAFVSGLFQVSQTLFNYSNAVDKG